MSTSVTARVKRLESNMASLATREDLERMMVANQVASSREQLAQLLEQKYQDVRRDLFKEFGWYQDPTEDNYYAMYKLDPLAAIAVGKRARDTWQMPPKLLVDGAEDDEFAALIGELDGRLGLYSAIAELDELSGIGEYGVMLMGIKGAKSEAELGQQAKANDLSSLVYLTPYPSKAVTVKEVDNNRMSPRYRMPLEYRINVNFGVSGMREVSHIDVHWSRVFHLASDAPRRLFGNPRLMRIINTIGDIRKMTGGVAESVYRLVAGSYVITGKDGYDFDPNDAELKKRIDEYISRFRRVLTGEGIDVQQTNPVVADISRPFEVLSQLVAADTGIPLESLIGSVRGDTAKAQDIVRYAQLIAGRRRRVAEPLLFALFRQWQQIGMVQVPQNLTALWEPIYEPSELEWAQTMLARAQALEKATAVASVGVISSEEARAFGSLPPEMAGTAVGALLDEEDEMLGDEEE